MGTRANNDVTAGARSIMQYCKTLQAKSGLTATEFAAECGFSRNYWFVRARFDAPLTISDCERIANVCGMTLKELFVSALRGQEASQIERTLQKLHDGNIALAAYDAPGKQAAINGEAGPDYDEPA